MAVIRKLERPAEELPTPRLLKSLKRKAKYAKSHDESNWLISYADMMTLLCVFYIMMFSMSKVNTQEFEKVKKEVAEHFNTKYKSPTEDLGKFATQIIQENGVAKDVTISSDGVGVTLAFHSTLFFQSSSADISEEGKQLLNKVALGIASEQKKTGKNYKIVVEGHTDAQPMIGGVFPSNWELSSARATRVIRLFLEDGFNAQNLLAIGYADTRPIVDSRNPDGSWNPDNLAKNRRVIIRVLLPDVDTIPWAAKPSAKVEPAAPTGAVPVPQTPVSVPVTVQNGGSQATAPAVSTPVANAPVQTSAATAPAVGASASVAGSSLSNTPGQPATPPATQTAPAGVPVK